MSLRACIKLTNQNLILSQHPSELLTYRDVYDTLQQMKHPVGPVHQFPHYVYFQIMSQTNHSLSRPSQNKLHEHHPPADIDKVKMEISFMPKRQTAYVLLDLSTRPHGTEFVARKSASDMMLYKHSIPHTTVVCCGKQGVVDMMSTCGAVFFYPNYYLLKELGTYSSAELSLINFVLSNSSKLVIDKERLTSGKSDNEYSVNKRVRFGFGQNQPESNTKFRHYSFSRHQVICTNGASPVLEDDFDTLNLPTMSTAIFLELPLDSRNFVMRVAESGQKIIRRYCGTNAMKDKLRHKLFTKELNIELGYPDLASYFEYFDIYVTTLDVELNRHMDVSLLFLSFVLFA